MRQRSIKSISAHRSIAYDRNNNLRPKQQR